MKFPLFKLFKRKHKHVPYSEEMLADRFYNWSEQEIADYKKQHPEIPFKD